MADVVVTGRALVVLGHDFSQRCENHESSEQDPSSGFYKRGLKECDESRRRWLASRKRCELALYLLLVTVALFCRDTRFVVEEFCKVINRKCTAATKRNPIMVVLEEVMSKDRENANRSKCSKYGLVIAWALKNCTIPEEIPGYIVRNGGIEGVDKLRRVSCAKGTDATPTVSGGAPRKASRLLNAPDDAIAGEYIIAKYDGKDWVFMKKTIDA